MSSDFLPMWAPDARAFKRATYMSSTDDVELLGKVRGEGEEEEGKEGAGTSTTPFGPHVDSEPEEAVSEPEVLLEGGSEEEVESEPSEPEAAPGPVEEGEVSPVDSEVEGALAALEAEVSTSEFDPEAVAQMEKEAFNRGKATAMAEIGRPKIKVAPGSVAPGAQ